jgi:hypothetical protein
MRKSLYLRHLKSFTLLIGQAKEVFLGRRETFFLIVGKIGIYQTVNDQT